jgi:hypothetical protein
MRQYNHETIHRSFFSCLVFLTIFHPPCDRQEFLTTSLYGFPDYRCLPIVCTPTGFDIRPSTKSVMTHQKQIPTIIPRRRIDYRKIIYVTLLVLFMATMFAMPFIYIVVRLNYGID